MDVVYFVRRGESNEELRHSLRSLSNIPHRNVYIIGYLPKWVDNVIHIDFQQTIRKNKNTTNMLKEVVDVPELSDNFILMNDDFYIMKKMDSLPKLNRGPLQDVLDFYAPANSGYYKGMLETKEYMESIGLTNLISYELHVPMIMNKKNVKIMFSEYEKLPKPIKVFNKRTVYGNMFNYGGKSIEDVKVFSLDGKFNKRGDFLSSDDDYWENSRIGKYIRKKFSKKGIYEK